MTDRVFSCKGSPDGKHHFHEISRLCNYCLADANAIDKIKRGYQVPPKMGKCPQCNEQGVPVGIWPQYCVKCLWNNTGICRRCGLEANRRAGFCEHCGHNAITDNEVAAW